MSSSIELTFLSFEDMSSLVKFSSVLLWFCFVLLSVNVAIGRKLLPRVCQSYFVSWFKLIAKYMKKREKKIEKLQCKYKDYSIVSDRDPSCCYKRMIG